MSRQTFGSILLLLIFAACATVPITGRKQVKLLPSNTILNMSLQNYNAFLEQSNVVNGTQQSQMVQRVGKDMAGAVESYLTQNGYKQMAKNFQWEFNLIESEEVNAWAMPGGKVAFYTGILPVTRDEKGLAVVMGHEIAHAVARHGNERMSQLLALQLGGMAIQVALRDKPEKTQQLFLTAYGLGTTVGLILPYSRLHETEADKMGLIFMAMAGYNPQESVSFWQRMDEMSNSAGQPEFLSTHPSHETRIETLKEYMPQAMKYYKK